MAVMELKMKETHFNSHAHVERDPISANRFRYSVDFNSHAHVERDSVHFIVMPIG